MAVDSELPPWQQLARAIERVLRTEHETAMCVVPCDRQADGQYARYAGLTFAWDLLVEEHYQFGTHQPMLLVGFSPPPVDGNSLELRIRAMLGWPGVACLSYGFTKDELIATAYQVVEGAKTQLPAELLPTVSDVMRITAEIRHWLENRLRNTQGALNDFERAARGEIRLHRSHLDFVASISGEHGAMLNRLWALELPVRHFANRSEGLKPLKTAVADFEDCWQALEVVRGSLRLSGNERQSECQAEAVVAYGRVRDALQLAIEATCDLDSEMIKWKGN